MSIDIANNTNSTPTNTATTAATAATTTTTAEKDKAKLNHGYEISPLLVALFQCR
jgi:hypothetical protein